MASLNTSTNGPSISKSYQSIANASQPTGAAASSPTYGQWAVFSVTAPLVSSFQQDGGNKESVLKVQSTGEGELLDLIDEFSDGRIQFAFVKVKDSNSGLPKNALIGWCGEGVPERTKGYFTSHLTAVSKLLHGYHVQITARSDRDLTPEGIIQKVADASGSKYSTSSAPPPVATATKPTVGSKPAFTPTQSSGATAPRITRPAQKVDNDGWGTDAPQITRTQLEKVESAYKPTKVNMRELTSSKPASTGPSADTSSSDRPDVVRGAYQPIGKVDIAAIRRQAQESGSLKDERPETVKGAYEPTGKVDIAAIRARAQKSDDTPDLPSRPKLTTPGVSEQGQSSSIAERSTSYSQEPERLTSMPKPKVANKFGGGSTFAGTKAPTPGAFDGKPSVPAAATGLASRTFADQGGKTPAQLWAEKKARERGTSGSGDALPSSGFGTQSPLKTQASGEGGWKSGYTGKSWAPVQMQSTGRSHGESVGQQKTGEDSPVQEAPQEEEAEEDAPASPAGGVSAMRGKFSGAIPMGAPRSTSFNRAPPQAPEPETSTKPNRGVPIPGMPSPPVQRRSPTPPTPEARDASPIRVVVPVSKTQVSDAHDEQEQPPRPLPVASLSRAMPEPDSDDEPDAGPDPARGAARTTAAASVGPPTPAAPPSGGERAKAEYDYEAAEDNEVSLREGEIVTDIQQVDPDWWQVKNESGQTGLVPSNYLSMLDGGDDEEAAQSEDAPPAAATSSTSASKGATATALYDYEAGEDNELSFPENATIENITFPDEDWWHGEYKGKSGLFPANYTKLDD